MLQMRKCKKRVGYIRGGAVYEEIIHTPYYAGSVGCKKGQTMTHNGNLLFMVESQELLEIFVGYSHRMGGSKKNTKQNKHPDYQLKNFVQCSQKQWYVNTFYSIFFNLFSNIFFNLFC